MIRKLLLALMLPAALALAGCTSSLTARVQRFNAMPPPDGQSFVVEAAEAEDRGGLEFRQYADHVRRHLTALGYREAASRRDASLIVTLGYGVDRGRQQIDEFPNPWGYRRFGPAYYSRFGYFGRRRAPFYWGWHDPFWDPFGYDVTVRTIYTSFLDLDIRRAADNQSLFEGFAEARSGTDELPVLVPNLIEAMFTGFPGNNGERVRITVTPERQQR
ncbi:DUF4136 domain-containing protein [Sphingosinicella sp.]|uniref:DUF4136 domain-containing protein n=1 Tax=Sphingosinicella sp. TaxID=1917971 RepID=UPI004037FB97